MFNEGENVFLLRAGMIFQFINGNWNRLDASSNIPEDSYYISYPIKHENFIYLLLNGNIMYRFDILNKFLEKFKAFKQDIKKRF